MEFAGLRHRDWHRDPNQELNGAADDTRTSTKASGSTAAPSSAPASTAAPDPIARHNPTPDDGIQPPRFTVDLSLPPSQRYLHIAPHLQSRIATANLRGLFDELIAPVATGLLGRCLHILARLALRRVYSGEESAELRGISKVTGVSMHLLVAFNVVLDLLLGCTSGGVKVEDRVSGGSSSSSPSVSSAWRSRMMHFRTLDWGMDPLRHLVVELDFVRSADGPVVASSVTYFGYVGVLTGVRRGLSLSLNFRPHHDDSTFRRRLAFRWQQLMVLFGFRRSISSLLRGCLLTPDAALDGAASESVIQVEKGGRWWTGRREMSPDKDVIPTPVVDYIRATLPSAPCTAAYLIFCTPERVYSLEKDHRAGSLAESDTFLTTYNHDRADESDPSHLEAVAHGLSETAIGMEAIVAYSIDRKNRMDRHWERAVKKRCLAAKRPTSTGAVSEKDVVRLVMDPHISNEETHYAVVMDPEAGRVLWRRVFPPPEMESGDVC